MKKFFSSFAFRTGIAVFLITALVVAAILVIVVGYISNVLYENVSNDLQLQSESVSKDLNVPFSLATDDLFFLSNLPEFSDLQDNSIDPNNLKELSTTFYALSTQRQNYLQVRFIDNSGKEIVRIDNHTGKPEIVPIDNLQDKSDRQYFKDALKLKKGELYVSNLELNKEGTPAAIEVPYRPVIRYATPVFNSSGEKIGIVIINLSAQIILSKIESELVQQPSESSLIVDSQGYYLSNPDPKKEWGGPNDLNTGTNLKSDYPDNYSRILSLESGLFQTSSQVLSFSRIQTNPRSKSNYIIVIRVASNDLLTAPINSLMSIMAVPLMVIFIILVVSVYIGARIIIKPIVQLNDTSKKIAKGDLSQRAHVGVTYSEMEEMTKTFNEMSQMLESDKKDQEKIIYDRTKELAAKVQELENIKSASLNIMEDIQTEKNNVLKEKEKINVILESIGDGVFFVDNDLKIVLFNKVAANLSGFDKEKALGKYYYDVLNFTDEFSGKISDQFIKDAIGKGLITVMPFHTVLQSTNENKIPVSDSAAPVKNKEGKVIGCVVVFRDVSREMAIDKAKTEFVSLASHQLKTPLSAIKWYLEMLLGGDAGKITKKQKEFMDELQFENERMIELVNGLLNVSRIELGTFSIEPVPTNIFEISDSVINELQPQIIQKGLVINKEYSGEVSKVLKLDPKLIRIVFQNLLSNSVKYTLDKGTVTVSIAKSNNDLLIKVQDNGLGIPKDQQDKVFSKLFRADNVRKIEANGTGLGLYVVKSIIQQSYGRVWFESEEGKGTTFYITLPLSGMTPKEGNKELTA